MIDRQWRAWIRDETGAERQSIRDTKQAAQKVLSDAQTIYRRCGVKIVESRIEQVG